MASHDYKTKKFTKSLQYERGSQTKASGKTEP